MAKCFYLNTNPKNNPAAGKAWVFGITSFTKPPAVSGMFPPPASASVKGKEERATIPSDFPPYDKVACAGTRGRGRAMTKCSGRKLHAEKSAIRNQMIRFGLDISFRPTGELMTSYGARYQSKKTALSRTCCFAGVGA